MEKRMLSVKTFAAIGIGSVLMFVLMRFVAVPTGVPNTNLNLGIAILAVFAAIFGPVAGFLIGFIGHTLTDLTWGGVWWSWVLASAIFGLIIGACRNWFKIEEGKFGVREALMFNGVQVAVNVVVWVFIARTLDLLIYREPFGKVSLQGFVAAGFNILVVMVLGTALIIGYSKTMGKAK